MNCAPKDSDAFLEVYLPVGEHLYEIDSVNPKIRVIIMGGDFCSPHNGLTTELSSLFVQNPVFTHPEFIFVPRGFCPRVEPQDPSIKVFEALVESIVQRSWGERILFVGIFDGTSRISKLLLNLLGLMNYAPEEKFHAIFIGSPFAACSNPKWKKLLRTMPRRGEDEKSSYPFVMVDSWLHEPEWEDLDSLFDCGDFKDRGRTQYADLLLSEIGSHALRLFTRAEDKAARARVVWTTHKCKFSVKVCLKRNTSFF